LTRTHPGPAQLVLLYGRLRIGKTELLQHWAAQSDVKYTYWAAIKESTTQQRNHLMAKLLEVPEDAAPVQRSWASLWEAVAAQIQDRRHILILDELPYAADADPAMLSALQHAWDQHFQKSNVVMILCGSHVRTMETILSRQSPLFGRMTGQWHLGALPFACLAQFFPNWSAEERVALYAIAGGVPAYLGWLDPAHSLLANIRSRVLSPGGMFLAEPAFLLYDEVREPAHYMSILRAIGAGAHTLNEISDRCFIPRTSVNMYLSNLQELRLVERRLPVTVKRDQRARSRAGRYHLSDPYFRFYFHFLEPYVVDPPLDPDRVLAAIKQNLRAFVGGAAFEELARQWVWRVGKAGRLPFAPESVGSHWSAKVQVDVVAVNWQTHAILLGECKWGADRVDRPIVRELLDVKTPLALHSLPEEGAGWKVHHALFARTGFTPAARREAEQAGVLLVDLKQLDEDLRE
jgi:AAA+ ATPase superfamily predicted ATPase